MIASVATTMKASRMFHQNGSMVTTPHDATARRVPAQSAKSTMSGAWSDGMPG